ncbi:MAG: class I SAM-dependent methyltransferase [Candidatus Promineifilaceae bacterium]
MTLSDMRVEREHICEQYKTKDNLQIRILTHERYSQPKVDFHKWVLDHISWTGRETVLDVGCGSAMYAEPVIQRCHRYIPADLSFGMLKGLAAPLLDRVNLDATSIPMGGGAVEVVLANHMLYHVPELDEAVREIHRVLKPGGVLIAATNSDDYMPELAELQARLARKFSIASTDQWENPAKVVYTFSLENGRRILKPVFKHIERYDLPGSLVFSDSEPLIDYLGSMRKSFKFNYPPGVTWKDVVSALRDEIDRQIVKNGEFRINKLAGVFVCQKEILQSSG